MQERYVDTPPWFLTQFTRARHQNLEYNLVEDMPVRYYSSTLSLKHFSTAIYSHRELGQSVKWILDAVLHTVGGLVAHASQASCCTIAWRHCIKWLGRSSICLPILSEHKLFTAF